MDNTDWLLEWTDDMSVGIPEIDAEHRHFAQLINDLNQAIIEHHELSVIRNRMSLILEDATQHFAHEESLFKQWDYPDTAGHTAKHLLATRAYLDIMATLKQDYVETNWIAAGLKVKKILVDHLLKEDMKYRDFYRAAYPDFKLGSIT
jgi:hemerythrin-like metal-binding protein